MHSHFSRFSRSNGNPENGSNVKTFSYNEYPLTALLVFDRCGVLLIST